MIDLFRGDAVLDFLEQGGQPLVSSTSHLPRHRGAFLVLEDPQAQIGDIILRVGVARTEAVSVWPPRLVSSDTIHGLFGGRTKYLDITLASDKIPSNSGSVMSSNRLP